MSDVAGLVDFEPFEIPGTALSINIEPSDNGKVKLTAIHAGETVESGAYSHVVFSEPGERNKFLSSVETSLEDRQSVDAAGARSKIKEFLADFGEKRNEEKEALYRTLSPELREILEGTHYPVEVYRGEPTTWKVTITFRGETRELDFTTSEMNGSGGALQEKIANHFLEFLEIKPGGWEKVRDEWVENKKVVDTGGETAGDAVADRVLEHLGDGVLPTRDREKVANAPSNAWFDESNTPGYSDAPIDATIVWVQDRYLVDKLESAGKTVEYKGQLVKDLISRGNLYGKRTRYRWSDGKRRKYYPFTPDALKIDPDQVGEPDDGDAAGEVEA